MALELNGTTGVSLVQDGVVTAADLASGAITASALPAGSVLQVVSSTISTQESHNTTSYADTALSVSITPTSSSSKILLILTGNFLHNNDGSNTSFRRSRVAIFRGGSASGTAIAEAQFGRQLVAASTQSGQNWECVSLSVYDSPATTDAITYNVATRTRDSTATVYSFLNFSGNTITAMEIAG